MNPKIREKNKTPPVHTEAGGGAYDGMASPSRIT
jgi:hypothetical protein